MPCSSAAALPLPPPAPPTARPTPGSDKKSAAAPHLAAAPCPPPERSLPDPALPLHVTFRPTGTELSLAPGYLVLATPNGRLRLCAETDIVCEAGGVLRIEATRQLELGTAAGAAARVDRRVAALSATRIAACVRAVTLRTEALELRARVIGLLCGQLTRCVDQLERRCRRLFERADERSRRIAGGDVLRARHARSFVRDSARIEARGIRVASDEVSSVDGQPIFVG